ncbi:transcriptional regulator [Clostridium zeae]|uniref:Transcriptional regulator n=1 Tax=Clostridium zeae TaxID=2759022 RepID=A0ABQ1EEG6_9CLOT|nr:helix-turn-helix domain-containing protein [Clostridium zeae]GFZ33161.1 transcriptional regulator [Clostridium zeae]
MNTSQEQSTYMCPSGYTMDVIGGKWKLLILWHLLNDGIKRYGEIKKVLPGITHKMLSSQLKELENDGIVHREEYQQIPPKVEYSLTEKGITLTPILKAISEWGSANMT